MSKILYCADNHIYPHKNSLSRLEDCLTALEWILETAQRRADHLIFLGDLLHDRQKVPIVVYYHIFQLFKKYDVPKTILVGNHDMWHCQKWEINSVKPLDALPHVEVIDSPTVKDIAGTKMDFLPYTKDPVSWLSHFSHPSYYLCSHLALDKALMSKRARIIFEVSVESDRDVVKVDENLLSPWKKVFLGHYHYAQQRGHVEYVGSPMQMNFSEAEEEKHIILLDTEDDSLEYIVNNFSPRHLIIPWQEWQNYDLEGHYVKIEVDELSKCDLMDIKSSITSKFSVASLEFRIKENLEESFVQTKEMQEKFDIHGDLLERWISVKGTNNLDEKKLLEIGKSICEN